MKRETLENVVDQHGAALYRFCRQLASNKTDADDLYQETFLAAVQQLQRIDERRNPKGYLISVAVYIWKSNRRKYARRQRLAPTVELEDISQQPDGGDLEQDLINQALCGQLREAVDGLDDKFRIPLYMHYTAEMTVDEIALAIRIPVGTVKSRLHRARMLIRRRLEAEGYEAG